MNRRLLLSGVLAAAAALERGAHAQCLVDALHSNGGTYRQSIALQHDRVLVPGTSVYEQRGDEWLEVARLVPPGHPPNEPFGRCVALGADVAAVTSEWDGGGVHVFELRGGAWVHVVRFRPTPNPDVYWDGALALSEDVLVFGDVTDDTLAPNAGAVHVYERIGGDWRHAARLVSPLVGAHDLLGFDVDVDGRTILASSQVGNGTVHAFERGHGGWHEVDAVTGGGSFEQFGRSVAISGDRAAVGSYAVTGDIGSAFVLRRRGTRWFVEAELVPNAVSPGDRLGGAVDIDGGRAVLGSYGFGHPVGRALLFEERASEWRQVSSLLPVLAADEFTGFFGESVALSGPYAAVGERGFHHVYDELDCAAVMEFCEATINSSGYFARIHHAGSLSVAANDFELRVGHCPSGELGFFFYGSTPTEVPWSQGLLCIGTGAGVFRLAPQPTDFFLTRRPVDFTAPPAGSGAGRIAAGSTWYFQFVFRDGAVFDFTDGLRVLFAP